MAVRKRTLTNRAVAALKTERDMVYWDRELPGFGIRVAESIAADILGSPATP